jgi:hypothetical protein
MKTRLSEFDYPNGMRNSLDLKNLGIISNFFKNFFLTFWLNCFVISVTFQCDTLAMDVLSCQLLFRTFFKTFF